MCVYIFFNCFTTNYTYCIKKCTDWIYVYESARKRCTVCTYEFTVVTHGLFLLNYLLKFKVVALWNYFKHYIHYKKVKISCKLRKPLCTIPWVVIQLYISQWVIFKISIVWENPSGDVEGTHKKRQCGHLPICLGVTFSLTVWGMLCLYGSFYQSWFRSNGYNNSIEIRRAGYHVFKWLVILLFQSLNVHWMLTD